MGWAFLMCEPAGGRVAHVADGDAARQLRELVLGEGVLHEPHRAVRVELLAVGRDDAGRLLPAVLQRVQPEVGHVGGFGVVEDAEDAALVVEVVVLQALVAGCDRAAPHPPNGPGIEHDEAALGCRSFGDLEPNRVRVRRPGANRQDRGQPWILPR